MEIYKVNIFLLAVILNVCVFQITEAAVKYERDSLELRVDLDGLEGWKNEPEVNSENPQQSICMGGKYVFDNTTGTGECICPPGYGHYHRRGIFTDDDYCRPCRCGMKTTASNETVFFNCTFKDASIFNDNKKCICDKGQADKGGRCTECACDNPEYICTFRRRFFGGYDKICIAPLNITKGQESEFTGNLDLQRVQWNPEENAPKDGCEGGTYVKNNSTGKEECVCPRGYGRYYRKGIFSNYDYCKECNCGGTQFSCIFNPSIFRDNKSCLCGLGYGDRGGNCAECHCGGYYTCTFKRKFFGGFDKICIEVTNSTDTSVEWIEN